jgi:outer membrane biosynthesis protein TonB
MTNEFDAQRHRKAFLYTALICSFLLIAFIFISWKVVPPAPPVITELMEVNLGNNDEGLGEEQPLIKGERSPEVPENSPEEAAAPPASEAPAKDEEVTPDDNAEEDAAPINKPVVKPTPKKITTPTPVTKPTIKPTTNPVASNTPTPKPKTPKILYPGAGKGGGNNPTQDNGYTMQGNNKNGKGDAGDPNGNKDSYGNKPGGKVGGPKVISGNRKIVVRYYSFTGELDKATINAVIKVSPAGVGTFLKIERGSTSSSSAYANAIRGYLQNMKFDPADEESTVTVQFNFNVQ